MKGPLCDECARSGILCEECSDKKSRGEISETDIQLAQLIDKLERRGLVHGATFDRAFPVEGLIVITTRGNVGSLVGKKGKVIRLLSKEFNRKVRIINNSDVKTALRDLVAPAKIQGINIVYKPKGDETKVLIAKEDKYKLIAPINTLQKIANQLTDKTVVIEIR